MAETTTILKSGGKFPPSQTIILGGVEVNFTRAWVDGERVMVASLDSDDPRTVGVIQHAMMFPGIYRVPGRPPKVIPVDAPKPSEAQKPAPPPMTPRDIALRNGWQESDLEGTGAGEQWGPEGGRSLVSGLCTAEMALCSPPKGWRRATQWPWDVTGWRGPTPEWKPPMASSKTAPPPAEVPVSVAAPEPVAEVEPTPKSDDDTDPMVKNVGSIDGYGTSEEAAQAVAVLSELLRATGSPPTRQKASYHLRKHGLPSPNDSQFQALLSSITL